MRETSRDLSALVVPQAGRVVATDDAWEPYRLVDADGIAVESVAAYLRDLQAAGRSAATARSYGLDLLRWFRFLWAVEVGWDRATRVEARDFCRWLQIAGKPTRPHWRRGDEPAGGARRWRAARRPYAASVRAHSETVLRSFYDFHLDVGHRTDPQPVPAGSVPARPPGARASQPDGPSTQRAGRAVSAEGAEPGYRAASRTRSSTRSSPGWARTGTGRWWRSTSPPGRGRASCCRSPRAGPTRGAS